MKYWPLSAIIASPYFAWEFAPELYQVQMGGHVMTAGAINACGVVANHTTPIKMPNLEVLQNPHNNQPRRIFRDYPELKEWLALERTGVVLAPDGVLYVVIDALH